MTLLFFMVLVFLSRKHYFILILGIRILYFFPSQSTYLGLVHLFCFLVFLSWKDAASFYLRKDIIFDFYSVFSDNVNLFHFILEQCQKQYFILCFLSDLAPFCPSISAVFHLCFHSRPFGNRRRVLVSDFSSFNYILAVLLLSLPFLISLYLYLRSIFLSVIESTEFLSDLLVSLC